MEPVLDNASLVTMNQSIYIEEPDDEVAIDRYIWIYMLPIIFIIGVCGNLLTILVMRRKRMKGTATSVYLTLLAVADTGVLVTGIIPEWLIQTWSIDLANMHQWICKFERVLFYTTGDVAIFVLVAFTCDRFIAVCFPLKKPALCTVNRAKLACLIVVLIAFGKNFYLFWSRGSVYDDDGVLIDNCGKRPPFTNFEKTIRPWIVLALVSLVPFCVILVCNVMIIKELFFSQRMRNMAASSSDAKAFTQTTAMCLSTSFAFLVLITPSIVLLIGKPNWNTEGNTDYDIAKAVSNQLTYINHSINFFLYCMTGERFRSEFIKLVFCKDSKARHKSVRNMYSISASTTTGGQQTNSKGSTAVPSNAKYTPLEQAPSRKISNGDVNKNKPFEEGTTV